MEPLLPISKYILYWRYERYGLFAIHWYCLPKVARLPLHPFAVSGALGAIQRMVIGLLLWCIRAYRLLLSPLLPPSCRFLPTCSEYAEEAIRCHGSLYGTWLALRRVMRCHPWGGSGLDPVPGTDKSIVTDEVDTDKRD